MKIWKSAASAFLMYSKIPMPNIEWKEENRKYALCFFPAIGIIIGFIFILWQYICNFFQIGSILKGAVSMLIPLLITGGIHLDGFCDTCDANASYGNKEKKLDILSDSHIGAFAVIHICAYLILETSLYSEIRLMKTAYIIALGFVMSRAVSGLAAVIFKSAKKSGTLAAFTNPSHKKCTIAVLLTVIIVVFCIMIIICPVLGIVSTLAGIAVFIYYRISAYKHFGGITGDLAGWFLQLFEIAIAISAIFAEKIMEAL